MDLMRAVHRDYQRANCMCPISKEDFLTGKSYFIRDGYKVIGFVRYLNGVRTHYSIQNGYNADCLLEVIKDV